MAAQNVFFAIDVDYRPAENSSTTSAFQSHLKHWVLRILLRLGNKYGLEKVRWGYTCFHSRTVKSANLVTRVTDFKELHEKAFSDFEEELLVKFNLEEKSPRCREKSSTQHKLKPSPASCVQNALKEILLDFQWDRPDLTSPTKVTLRPRRSSRSGRNVPLQDDDIHFDKNILFVVSECPCSNRDLGDYLSLRRDDRRNQREIQEQVLPKGLIDMLIQRKVVLHWADSGILKGNSVVEDYAGMDTVAELLGQVGGRVVPMLSPCLPLRDQHPGVNPALAFGLDAFPIDSANGYIQSSQRLQRQAFPSLDGSLCWIAEGGDKQSCGVTLEPVSFRQRSLRAPVEVTLRGVLQDLDTLSLSRSASESWILQCPDAELVQVAFQQLRELSTGGSSMLAEVSEGGVVCSAVLSVLSSCTALVTVLQPLVTLGDEHLPASFISSETADISTDLPDVVSSVLNVMYDTMENEDCSEEVMLPLVPDWANQELKQGSCARRNGLVEGWFPLSDQSGISCHLMESMKLLNAAPEEEEHGEEYSDTQQELTSCLSELYQSSAAGSSGNQRSKKRGTQRTPVRQKMKTMSRSLQMLNFARLNVKAQKTQADSSSVGSARGADKGDKRCSGDRTKPGLMHFNSEEELLSHLGLAYQKAVDNRLVSVPSQVQDLVYLVKAFIKTNTDAEVSFLDLVEKHLLKTCQSIRQLYGDSSDVESKIRECQLQAVLRLELCRKPEQQEVEVVEQRVEDVADLFRIISRGKDAVYLSRFMQDEVLPVYLNSIPKVLADVYHSLGTQLPDALIAVLPPDYFSDESMAKDSVSVSPSPLSATQSHVSSVGDHLEELRIRSAKKRRQNMITRHKSMSEAPQVLRQIEMPRKSTRLTKPKLCVPVEKPAVEEPPPQKHTVQEVTKVRRNLFNQVTISPSKKSKMPRSQSVSAVEGLRKRKRSHVEDDVSEQHTLLTKKVTETPLHKQVSNRLLHRQRTGRRSGESDVCIIEESPVKPVADLRRSPRIKSLTRRHSSVFYSSSQPRSRNLDRALSSSQLCHSEGKGDPGHINCQEIAAARAGSARACECNFKAASETRKMLPQEAVYGGGFNVSSVRSPVRLLFGATQSPGRLRHPTASSSGDQGSKDLSLTSAVFESPNKTPQKLHSDAFGSAVGCRTPRSPRTPGRTAGENGMTLRGSPFRSPAAKNLVVETPKKSPLKGILKTPMKNLLDCASPNGAWLRSPNIKTPKKSVTWSPSPRKRVSNNPINLPESPLFARRYSPRLMKPSKSCNPDERTNVFKTPDKMSQRKSSASPETLPRKLEIPENLVPEQSESSVKSGKIRRTLSLPCKVKEGSGDFASNDALHSNSGPFYFCPLPLKPNIQTSIKSPVPSQRMCTRSGRTPVKDSSSPLNSQAILGTSPSPIKGLSLPTDKSCVSQSSGSHRSGISLNPQERESQGKIIKEQSETNLEKAVETSSSDSQQFDCSEFSTTEDESIDISEASVVKTQLTGGIKMNIAFSRKSSRSSEVFTFKGKQATPAEMTPSRSYGFRQTPDRRQREAEARLGYSSGTPKFSTPRTRRTPACGNKFTNPQPLTYEVELEMQASGLPKLKLRRTDSFNAGDAPKSATKGMASPLVLHNMSNIKVPQSDSPLVQCSRHRDPGCISPSLCNHGTPAKGTPRKGVQTFICQSITPTRYPTNNLSPLASGELTPLTPSPQSRERSTPENLNSWPRKKRARIETYGNKEQVIKGVPLFEKTGILDDPELEGVFSMQGVEELKESVSAPFSKKKLSLRSSQLASQQSSPEGMDWTESVVQKCDVRDTMKSEQFVWLGGKVDTPPGPKVKKPVSASGIFALTQSPLLYKKSTVINEATQCDGSKLELDISPLCQPRRRRTPSRTYSRKKLLD
ncbi:treslin-like isoform X2 [Myxocyprinus asiaticus]|uniref:treslin-like isoform X2 n=1 Tax=Myxocyprinus asiaticus TaxID=70543 RepID=UPI002223E236|nr:treslin-like isoform X2 [Myxocyprinus asiaticus]